MDKINIAIKGMSVKSEEIIYLTVERRCGERCLPCPHLPSPLPTPLLYLLLPQTHSIASEEGRHRAQTAETPQNCPYLRHRRNSKAALRFLSFSFFLLVPTLAQ
eukprot:TRINITY_DN30776_c0_g1_i1.p1 TRINITY_DN30776_c0_g1~~TRINITY_DN30776_c0_g1_i1.p1  ORF type:complete len:104 (-),score=12.67 TRINITY_DN30776_c0_g1_i1:23-334(-)